MRIGNYHDVFALTRYNEIFLPNDTMLDLNALNQLKQLKTELKDQTETYIGIVEGSRGKYGFVNNDQQRVFLAPEQMNKVFVGDRISFSIETNQQNKPQAIVETIEDSFLSTLVGQYVVKGKGHFIQPLDQSINNNIFIPPKFRNNAKDGELIKAKVTQHPFKHGKAQAKIETVFGNQQEAGVWHKAIIAQYHYDTFLDTNTIELDEDDLQQVFEKTSKQRLDLTDKAFFTIDGKYSKDLDDAIYIEKTEDHIDLKVAIADPSVFIIPKDAVDQRAQSLMSSVYLPGNTIHMLPKSLSERFCSLLPEQKRLAIVLQCKVDFDGHLIDYRLDKAVIKSQRQYSYEEADQLIDEDTNLFELKQLCDKRQHIRNTQHVVMLQNTDYRLKLNQDLSFNSINTEPSSQTRKMIEEIMLLANYTVADFLKQHHSGLFICQAGFKKDNLVNVQRLTGLDDNQTEALRDLDGFQQLFRDSNNQRKAVLQKRLSRSQVALQSEPHMALGFNQYCTFTSPIRKYVDLINHRIIHKILDKQTLPNLDNHLIEKINQQQPLARRSANQLQTHICCNK